MAHVDRFEEKEGTSRPGCRSKHWASEDRRDELCVTGGAVRHEFSRYTEICATGSVKFGKDNGNRLRKIREVRADGFVQKPKRNTCKTT